METKTSDFVYVDKQGFVENADASRKFIANVFLWMFVALGISALCTYIFAFNPELSAIIRDPITNHNTIWGTVVTFAPLAFVFLISGAFNKFNFIGLVVAFLAFAALMGMSLSTIFYMYSVATISGTFITSAVVFGVMAVGGYITHQDLTKFGSIMIMLLIGIIVATLLNAFLLHSGSLGLIISYIGVAVFVGLTAYDVQKLKRMGAVIEAGDESGQKMAIMGALTLYLDFINLFLMLLRVFGGNRR